MVVLGGCTADQGLDLPPLILESEHALIGWRELTHPPCNTDLEAIDARVEFVEDVIGDRREQPIEIYLFEFGELPTCGDFWACYDGNNDRIYTPWFAVDHELVHAVTRSINFPSLFWEEGNAEVLAGGATLKSQQVTLTVDGLSAQELPNYVTAAHFQRFLVETRGLDAYVDLVQNGFDLEANYGESPSALVAEYEEEAPAVYPPIEPCPHPRLTESDGTWEETVSFSCESGSQYETVSATVSRGAAAHRAVELEAGTYEVRADGGDSFYGMGCQMEALDEHPDFDDFPSNGSLPNEADGAAPFRFAANETHVLELTEGTYRFTLSSGKESTATMSLSIRRLE